MKEGLLPHFLGVGLDSRAFYGYLGQTQDFGIVLLRGIRNCFSYRLFTLAQPITSAI